MDFLAEFDVVMEYKSGKLNQVADALSRRAELAALNRQNLTSNQVQSDFCDKIREALDKDPLARDLLNQAKEGKTRHFWHCDGLLFTAGR